MKIRNFIALLLLLFSAMCFGQEIELKNVRQQVKPIVEPIWETSVGCDYRWPTILIVRDYDNVQVENENFIPEQKFALYRLAYLSPHSSIHYIIVRNDRGYIVNMQKTLAVILSDVISVADKFKLTDSELIETINAVIKGYNNNYIRCNPESNRIKKPFFER